jgi:hypothetical protein
MHHSQLSSRTPSLLLVICMTLALMLPSALGFPSRFGQNSQKQTIVQSTKGDNSNDRKPWEIDSYSSPQVCYSTISRW